MKFEGGCYCGKIRYLAEGEPRLKAQCHCRECQYISGGAPNMFMLIAPQGFRYTSGGAPGQSIYVLPGPFPTGPGFTGSMQRTMSAQMLGAELVGVYRLQTTPGSRSRR